MVKLQEAQLDDLATSEIAIRTLLNDGNTVSVFIIFGTVIQSFKSFAKRLTLTLSNHFAKRQKWKKSLYYNIYIRYMLK